MRSSGRPPTSAGMPPISLFHERLRVRSAVSPRSSVGTLPVSRRSISETPVTRCGVPPSVTPSQPVMAVSTLQFSVAVPLSPSFAPSSAAQSAASPVLAAGSTPSVVSVQGVGAPLKCAVAVMPSSICTRVE